MDNRLRITAIQPPSPANLRDNDESFTLVLSRAPNKWELAAISSARLMDSYRFEVEVGSAVMWVTPNPRLGLAEHVRFIQDELDASVTSLREEMDQRASRLRTEAAEVAEAWGISVD